MGKSTRIGLVTVAYNEQRLIAPFLRHIPDWVDEKLVLRSLLPWQGKEEPLDKTAEVAVGEGATVIEYYWPTEAEQRNAGQEYLMDYDWIIILDPDEFLSNKGWANLKRALKKSTDHAHIVEHQRVFWKDKEVYPHTDYKQIIAVKPYVRFSEARVVDYPYTEIPVELFHFSWARTDEEIKSKISHYSHADELIPNWYDEVWLGNKQENLHPKSPETLKSLIPAQLPPELERLNLCKVKKT